MKEGTSRRHILDIATSCVDEILKVSIILHFKFAQLLLLHFTIRQL